MRQRRVQDHRCGDHRRTDQGRACAVPAPCAAAPGGFDGCQCVQQRLSESTVSARATALTKAGCGVWGFSTVERDTPATRMPAPASSAASARSSAPRGHQVAARPMKACRASILGGLARTPAAARAGFGFTFGRQRLRTRGAARRRSPGSCGERVRGMVWALAWPASSRSSGTTAARSSRSRRRRGARVRQQAEHALALALQRCDCSHQISCLGVLKRRGMATRSLPPRVTRSAARCSATAVETLRQQALPVLAYAGQSNAATGKPASPTFPRRCAHRSCATPSPASRGTGRWCQRQPAAVSGSRCGSRRCSAVRTRAHGGENSLAIRRTGARSFVRQQRCGGAIGSALAASMVKRAWPQAVPRLRGSSR